MPTKIRRSLDPTRLDENESAFFKRQLEYVKTRTYDTKQKRMKAFQLLPISTEAPIGASEITYRKFTGIGFAKIIADYANDFPRVDVFGEEVTVKVKDIGASFGYSIKEIRASQMAGTRLDQRRANFARRAVDQKIDAIAWNGSTVYGISGFIAYPGITLYTVLAGVSTTKTWITKTPDEIVYDMSEIVAAVMTPTNGEETPNVMLVPLAQYNLISNTRMTGGSDTTIMKFFLDNNPHIERIEWLTELTGAGTGATDRYMVYRQDDEHLTLEIPQPYEQFPVQRKNMEFEAPVHASTAGVIVYYPLAIAYGDGI